MKESQKRAQAKYDKTHTVGVYLKLNLQTDADILRRLKEKGTQPYIKRLIREDIERG